MTDTYIGDAKKLNPLKGVAGVVLGTDKEFSNLNEPVAEGIPIYNSSDRKLVISDGKTPPKALPNHAHPELAPAVHSHMYGANQPWFMANARLWYDDDIDNHPELVRLDGSEISDDLAEHLSTIFPGTKLLTTPISEDSTFTEKGFENASMYLTVNKFVADWPAMHLVDDELDFNSVNVGTDQWLTGSTGLTDEAVVTITFKGNFTYRPDEYWIIPANAPNTLSNQNRMRPTPNTWTFEGSNDGNSWTVLDSKSGITLDKWPMFEIQTFKVNTTETYSMLRLHITKWNAGAEEDLSSGLRRFWIFGRKKGVFCLPDIPSPLDSFTWVVPSKNMNVGLVHEEIGDIGKTSLLPDNLPSYRIPTDGRSISKTDKSLLYAAIGHSCDHVSTPNCTFSSGATTKSDGWDAQIQSTTTAAYIDFESTDCLGGFTIDSTGHAYPASLILEGYNGTEYVEIMSIANITKEEYEACGGKFLLDTTIADSTYQKYRINIINWHDNSEVYGFKSLTIFTHPKDEFYVPKIADDVENGVYNYIVADNTAADVTPNIIQRMQKNIADLSSALASVQNQLNNIDTSITK